MPFQDFSSGKHHRKNDALRKSSLRNEFRRLVQETIENSQLGSIPPSQSISNVTESSVNSSCAITDSENVCPDAAVKEKSQNLTQAEQFKVIERQWSFVTNNGSDQYMYHASQETSRTLIALRHLALKCAAQRRCCERSRMRKFGSTPTKQFRPPNSKVVTLTMELNGHEVPHLIASGNKWSNFLIDNIHRIQEELPGVKIQFADNVDPKDLFPESFTQTRVVGPAEDLSKVRLRIIQMSPVMLCVPIYDFALMKKYSGAVLDNWLKGPLAKFNKLEFFYAKSSDKSGKGMFNFASGFRSLYPGDPDVHEYFLIKGTLTDMELMNEGALSLRNLLYGKSRKVTRVINFASSMEIPASLDSWLCGGIVDAIGMSSGAKIVCTSIIDTESTPNATATTTTTSTTNAPAVAHQVNRTYFIGGQPVPIVEALMDFYVSLLRKMMIYVC